MEAKSSRERNVRPGLPSLIPRLIRRNSLESSPVPSSPQATPAVARPLPGAPPLVVDVPTVVPLTPVEDLKKDDIVRDADLGLPEALREELHHLRDTPNAVREDVKRHEETRSVDAYAGLDREDETTHPRLYSRASQDEIGSSKLTNRPQAEVPCLSDASDLQRPLIASLGERSFAVDEGLSDGSVRAVPKRGKKAQKETHRSGRKKRRERAMEVTASFQTRSPSPPTSPPDDKVPDRVANADDGFESDGRAEREPTGSGESAQPPRPSKRTFASLRTRLARIETKVRGDRKQRSSGSERESQTSRTPDGQDREGSSPSSTENPRPTSSHRSTVVSRLQDPGRTDHSQRSTTMTDPRGPLQNDPLPRNDRVLRIAGLELDPFLVIGVAMLGMSMFRITSRSLSSASPVASGPSSLYIAAAIACLVIVVLLGLWAQGKGRKNTRNGEGDQDILAGSDHRHSGSPVNSEVTASADKHKKPSEDVDQEDTALQHAQEQIKQLFPHRHMHSAVFSVFYDLMHAPWQEPDPEALQRLRRQFRKEWGKEYKPEYETSLESLRDIAVQLFADYLRVQDRGAYLTGELLRIEIMSHHKAIQISAFPGENPDVNVDISRERANWERALQTIRQLPGKWSELFPDQSMPPIEIVACRPPADFDSRSFQFLRDCARAPRQMDSAARKRYKRVKGHWWSCKSRGLPLSGIEKLLHGVRDDTRDGMMLALFELTKPSRITVDYLPHRHRQAEALGWAGKLPSTRLRRASCFSDVAKACATYTKNNRLDILDLGPCLPMVQGTFNGSRATDIQFAFAKTRVGTLQIALDECPDSVEADEVTEAQCLAATLCDPTKHMLPMFTGDSPAWLVLHFGSGKQKTDFKDTVESFLMVRSTSSRIKQLLALMTRTCSTTEASANSSRIWSDGEIKALGLALESG